MVAAGAVCGDDAGARVRRAGTAREEVAAAEPGAASAAGNDRRLCAALHRPAAGAAAAAAGAAGGATAGSDTDGTWRCGEEHPGDPSGAQAGGGWVEAGGAVERGEEAARCGAAAGGMQYSLSVGGP